MPRRTHSQNKYSTQVESRATVIPLRGDSVDPLIRLELSPGRTQTLDFSFLSERPQLQKVFVTYIRLLGDSVAPLTKRNHYQSLRNFSLFLDEYEDESGTACCETFDIDGNLLLNFRLWLETRELLPRPVARNRSGVDGKRENGGGSLSRITYTLIYSHFVGLLRKVRSYRPECFPRLPAKLPVWRGGRKDLKPAKDVLGVEDLKRILAAAKCESDRVKLQRERIQELLKRTENRPVLPPHSRKPNGYWMSLENIVHTLIREIGVGVAVEKNMKRSLLEHQKTSPTEVFGMYVPVREGAFLPFALQLYVMTALNVSSLMTLTRDCIQNFPLPQYRKLIYNKPRSGWRKAKSQLLPAPAAKSRAGNAENPISIIEFILEWTEPLIPYASENIKTNLFIYRAGRGRRGLRVRTIPTHHPFEAALRVFLDRYRKSHRLPHFSLSDLRPAVATYLYLQTKDIFRVQRFLGHSSIRTTIRYIRGRIIAGEHDKSMAGAIEQVIRRILPTRGGVLAPGKESLRLPMLAAVIEGNAEKPVDKALPEGRLMESDAESIKESGVMTLVARCRRPDQPPAFLNVPPGQVCTMVDKCLTCPNAVVLEEDLPKVLLRIGQIWEERNRLSEEGWQILYANSWLALNQVARLFSKEALERAERRIEAELGLTAEG